MENILDRVNSVEDLKSLNNHTTQQRACVSFISTVIVEKCTLTHNFTVGEFSHSNWYDNYGIQH